MATPAIKLGAEIPSVAIVGRVNVGKSTLFNRLLEENKSLVSDIPGTTRTNNEGYVIWRGRYVRFIDTGGLTFTENVPLEEHIIEQSLRAIEEAEVVLFVTDGKVGILPQERELARRLHAKVTKPVIVVANKIDNNRIDEGFEESEWRKLGFGVPFRISAGNGRNVGDLLDLVFVHLGKTKRRPKINIPDQENSIKISIIGRPNVGKSSLFNKLIGDDEVIVSPMAHTTREPHDTVVEYQHEEGNKQVKETITFVDTAGIRRKAHVSGELEKEGIRRSIESIEHSDIILFVIDGNEPISSQDRQLGGLLEKRVKSVVIIINKWDLATDVDDAKRNAVKKMVYSYFPHLDFAPIVFVSSLTGYRTHQLFPLIIDIWRARHTEVSEYDLEKFLRKVTRAHLPTKGKGTRPPEIVGMRQLGSNPPVFEIFIKYRTSVHISYVHYLENKLREDYNFLGTPIMIKLSKMKR